MIEYNKDKLKLKVLKIFNHGQNIYYFNDDECLCVTDTKTALDLRILGVSQFDDETYIAKVSIHSDDLPADEHGFNILRFHKAIKLSKIGDSMDNVIQLYLKTMLEKGCKSEGVARFLTKIERPMFGRYPDNKNEKTFNYVNMEANVLCRDNNMEYIKENKKEIIRHVKDRLEKNLSFRKYGADINDMKLSKMMYSDRNHVIFFVFENTNP